MIAVLAWPAVALCFLALLWRGVNLLLQLSRGRFEMVTRQGYRIDALERTVGAVKLDAEHALKGVAALEDQVRNLEQRVPSTRAR